jgi:hypothetical protein
MVVLMRTKRPRTALTGVLTLLLASILMDSSCTHSTLSSTPTPATPAPATPKPPQTSLEAFPPPLPGDKTEGVVHVLQVLDALWQYERSGRNHRTQTIGFQFPENEINEYLAYSLRIKPRPGISRTAVKLLQNDEIAALIEIDFDALKKWPSWSMPAVLAPLLSGRRALRVDAQFHANDGALSFTLNHVYAPDGSVILNKVMLDMIQAVAIHQPESYNTSAPVPLPFGLKRVWTQKQLAGGET